MKDINCQIFVEILADLIQAGSKALRYEIYKVVHSVCNKNNHSSGRNPFSSYYTSWSRR